MKIAIIVSSKKNAGPVTVAADQVRLLVNRGHECVLFYFDEVDSHCVDFACPSERISLKTRIDFSQFDVVHCHGGRPNLYVLLHKPLFAKTKFFTTIHSYIFQDFRYQYGRIGGILHGVRFLFSVLRFDSIIALSKDAVSYYKRFLFFKKIDFLYNTINVNLHTLPQEQQDEINAFKGDSILLGLHGVLNKNKGQDIVIANLPKLPDCKLFLLGTGPEEKHFKYLAEQNGVADRVYWGGFRNNAVDYLPYYDIFLLPSHSEGCPLAMLEAVAMNKKIVCSNIPVLREMFSDTEVSFFDINKTTTFADAVETAIAQTGDNTRLQKRFQQNF